VASDAHRPAVDLVALLASAGGLDALSTVLRDLPTEFPAVVVQQHLADQDSVLPAILRRQTARRISWAQDGQAIGSRDVVVCPPGRYLKLARGGRCRLRNVDDRAERRCDVLLASIAEAYGPRSVGVVLSGSGQDGAAGTAAMKRAGATVIAESPDTAQYPSMPMAAARAGADLVLPVHQIGCVLASIVDGAPLPEPRSREAPETTPPVDDGVTLPATRNSAAARAELARLRADELRLRRQDLAEGCGATAHTMAVARRRAAESRRRAQLAHQAAEEAALRRGH